MTNEKRKIVSVWLILNDGENNGKAVLQKRSQIEKKFPYVCQATWAGKVELGEEVFDALIRECNEELGEDFANNFDFSKLKLYSKHDFARAEDAIVWESYDYSANVNESELLNVKLHEGAFPEFVYADGPSLNQLKSGNDPLENNVLFDDQYIVLKEILNGN